MFTFSKNFCAADALRTDPTLSTDAAFMCCLLSKHWQPRVGIFLITALV